MKLAFACLIKRLSTKLGQSPNLNFGFRYKAKFKVNFGFVYKAEVSEQTLVKNSVNFGQNFGHLWFTLVKTLVKTKADQSLYW